MAMNSFDLLVGSIIEGLFVNGFLKTNHCVTRC